MTESEYIHLLAMLTLGGVELQTAANNSLTRLNEGQWNAFSEIAAEHHVTIRAFKNGYKRQLISTAKAATVER